MSFILDALRKSDQQRQRSATPTLTTAQTTAAPPRQPALLWYGLMAAALVGAGILIGWMHQAPSEPVAMTIPPGPGKPVETRGPAFTAAPLAAAPETFRKPEPPAPQREATTPLPAATPPSLTAVKPPTAVTPPLPGPAVVATTAKETAAPRPAEPANPVAGDAQRESSVMLLSELPPAIQQEIPKLSILAHSYSSKPKARFVFINDRMVREEEYPVPGLRLEQITPDGMVFSYRGYRFHRAANADPH